MKYYKCPNTKYNLQVIDVIYAWNLDKHFILANVLKYLLRGKFNTVEDRISDLEKAKTYIDMEIANLKR